MTISRTAVLLTCALAAAGTRAGRGEDLVDQRPLPVGVEEAFPELRITLPVVVTHAGDGSRRIFVGTQLGEIHVFPKQPDLEETKIFLDIRSKVVYEEVENEEGLLGLAFHPQYKKNGCFFVYYTTTDAPHTSVISRFRVSRDDPDRADPASEEEILRIPQVSWNHNGGTLEFGPDGLLYIALGDGGRARDPLGHGQNLATLHGSILRIDVDRKEGDRNYGIPPDNPFATRPAARPEIWAYGFRTVWRMAFDRQTGLLWAADNGEDLWEEIDIVQRGGNYGWNLREGRHKFGLAGSGPRDDLIEPIWEYQHPNDKFPIGGSRQVGMSIVGGCVYRGPRLPLLDGAYLYGDYVVGSLWALRCDAQRQRVTENRAIQGTGLPVMTFGEDEDGEVYVTTMLGGGILYQFKQLDSADSATDSPHVTDDQSPVTNDE
jgi:glucose/arabinose dehydrogenase